MYNILLVDDERIIMEGLAFQIRRFDLGFDEFRYAEDGADALAIVDKERPDVIVTDIRMEHVDGLQLTEELRKKGEWGKQVPIVIISGYCEFEYAKRAIGHRVFDYLTKPISEQGLREVMGRVKAYLEEQPVGTGKDQADEDATAGAVMRLLGQQPNSREEVVHTLHEARVYPEYYRSFVLVEWQYPPACDPSRLLGLTEGKLLYKWHTGQGLVCLLGYAEAVAGGSEKRIQSSTAFLTKESARICLGDQFDDIAYIGEAYRQLLQTARQRKLWKDRTVIRYADVRGLSGDGPVFDGELKAIVTGTASSDMSSVLRHFELIYRFVNAANGLSIVYVEYLYRKLCGQLLEAWGGMRNHPTYEPVLERLRHAGEMIERCASYADIHFAVKKMTLDLYDIHEKNKHSLAGTTMYVQKAKQYMAANLDDCSLTLQLVADKLMISSAYLSTIFKKETGIGFSDYLKKIRIERALEKLRQEETNVSAIGKSVGFIGDKVFFDVFKKQMGISPARYRRKIRSES